jgi:hypothetical protein
MPKLALQNFVEIMHWSSILKPFIGYNCTAFLEIFNYILNIGCKCFGKFVKFYYICSEIFLPAIEEQFVPTAEPRKIRQQSRYIIDLKLISSCELERVDFWTASHRGRIAITLVLKRQHAFLHRQFFFATNDACFVFVLLMNAHELFLLLL